MPKHLKPRQVAALLGISASQLRKPEYRKMCGIYRTKGGQRRFRDTKGFRSDVSALIAKRQKSRSKAASKIERRKSRSEAAWRDGDSIVLKISRAAGSNNNWISCRKISDRISRLTGHSRDWTWDRWRVSKAFPAGRRKPGLLWLHHRYAASTSHNASDWLKKAARNKWGPRQLCNAMGKARAAAIEPLQS